MTGLLLFAVGFVVGALAGVWLYINRDIFDDEGH